MLAAAMRPHPLHRPKVLARSAAGAAAGPKLVPSSPKVIARAAPPRIGAGSGPQGPMVGGNVWCTRRGGNVWRMRRFLSPVRAQDELYPEPGFPWQYPDAKQGTTLADWWFLWITQAAHYAIFASQLWLAYRIYEVVQLPSVGAAVALPFWAILCPVFQALAGFGPVLMHEYEGWQIAPFQEPPVNNSAANNQQLREAAFRVLFQWQGIAAGMMALGVFGVDSWTLFGKTLAAPVPLYILLAGLAAMYFAPRFPTLLFNPNKFLPFLPANKVFPVPLWVMPTFGLSIAGFTAAQAVFYGAALGSGSPEWGWALAITIVNLVGGVLEGLFAESTFNQAYHLLAVLFLNAGGLLQVWLLWGL